MKKIILILVLALTAVIMKAQEGDVAKIGDKIPSFVLKSKEFGEVKATDLKGKVVLVTLFTTWCGPCQKELAEFESTLYPKYKDNKDFKLLVIGREHSDEEIEKYLERKKFSFPIYPDEEKLVTPLFATKFIPRCYLIDQSGKIVYATQGFRAEDFTILMEEIESLL